MNITYENDIENNLCEVYRKPGKKKAEELKAC